MVVQGRWNHDNSLTIIPHVEPHMVHAFTKIKSKRTLNSLAEIIHHDGNCPRSLFCACPHSIMDKFTFQVITKVSLHRWGLNWRSIKSRIYSKTSKNIPRYESGSLWSTRPVKRCKSVLRLPMPCLSMFVCLLMPSWCWMSPRSVWTRLQTAKEKLSRRGNCGTKSCFGQKVLYN